MVQCLYKNGRHYNTLFCLCAQYALDFPPDIRGTIDYVFLMREPILANRKRLYDNFASIIPTFELFCQIMDEVTGDYTALVISNMTQTNDWTKCIFWYRSVKTLPPWRLGSDYYWDFNSQRYDKNFKIESEFF